MTIPSLDRIVALIDDLPTLPKSILRITEVVNSPKSSGRDLANVITDDQVLTARLLRLVNSSFYGFPQKISTVTGAIMILGFDAIRNLLLTTTVYDLFRQKDPVRRMRQEELWDHSLGCALGARVIGDVIQYEKVEELFVAGLLHDIGKIVEMIYLKNEIDEIARLVAKENILMRTAEARVLGYTHAEVGELLAARWNLPAKLIQTLAFHHQPSEAGRFAQEAAVIHLADILCRALEMGYGGDNLIPALDAEAWRLLGLGKHDVAPIMRRMEREYADITIFKQ